MYSGSRILENNANPVLHHLHPSAMVIFIFQLSRDCSITVHNLFGEGTPVAAFQRLSMMMRDLPDPLASANAHLYLARRAQLLLPPDAGCLTHKNTFTWFCHSLKVEICHRTGWCVICPCGLQSLKAQQPWAPLDQSSQ
jgi:hypothetical protein